MIKEHLYTAFPKLKRCALALRDIERFLCKATLDRKKTFQYPFYTDRHDKE